MKLKFFLLSLPVLFMIVIFTSESMPQGFAIKGTLTDAFSEKGIPNAKITAIQGYKRIEQSTDKDGTFKLSLSNGPATISYQASGYMEFEDEIIVTDGMEINKLIPKDSANGWSTILLLLPGVFGLFVAWFKEFACGRDAAETSCQSRLLVALVNGIVWAVVLACIYYNVSLKHGVTKIQFFHSSVAFEFFVPFLGYLGSLLFVFDLFRDKESDSFKDKEFGMRIIMGPYVSIVFVALFGKEFEFINLESDTGQGILAFVSGLIVVVAIQGIIERANEMLGKWRRKNNPYVASPLAKKFELSEREDKRLSRFDLRHPEQLLMLSVNDLNGEQNGVDFDKNMIFAMKRQVEAEQLQSEISELIWNRLKTKNISTIQDFSTLSAELLQKIAKEKPELSDKWLLALRDKTRKFLDGNGAAFA